MKALLTIVLTFLVGYTFCQNIDSLEVEATKVLEKEIDEVTAEDVKTLLSLSDHFEYIDVEKAEIYAQNGLKCSKNNSDLEKYEVNFIILIASCLNQQNNIDSSNVILKNAIEDYHTSLNDSIQNTQKGLLNQYLSFNYYDQGRMEDAVKQMDIAARLYDKTNNIKRQISAKYNLANFLLRLDNLDEAENSFLEILEKTDDGLIRNSVYTSLGTVESKRGNLEVALKHYLEGLKYNEFANQKEILIMNVGIAYRKLENYSKSIEYLKKAEDICLDAGRTRVLPLIYINMANVYTKSGDHKNAIKTILKSQEYVEEDNLAEIAGIHDRLAELYESEGDYKKALENYKIRNIYTDSIEDIERSELALEINSKFETEKKEAENQLLKKEKELQAQTISNQKYVMAGSAGGVGLLGLISYLLFRQSSERKKKNEKLAKQKDQIDALHKDLAHRVKNNLFFVSTLMKMQANRMENSPAKQAIMEGESRIEAMSLLHRKLNLNTENELIDIGGYIGEICDNLSYSFPFEGKRPEIRFSSDHLLIDGESAMRIGLIINELVTNSFKHAFHRIDEPIIDIHIASIDQNKYRVSYSDNGVGLNRSIDIDKSESMGMKLIYTLTKQLGGIINIKEPEKGTLFEFEFESKNTAA